MPLSSLSCTLPQPDVVITHFNLDVPAYPFSGNEVRLSTFETCLEYLESFLPVTMHVEGFFEAILIHARVQPVMVGVHYLCKCQVIIINTRMHT